MVRVIADVRAQAMSGVRYLSVAAVLASASSCIGTMDSLHAVKGEAPSAGNCEITVTEADGSRVVEKEKVSGVFSVSYMASGPFPPKVDVAASCNGVKVRELKGISPRNAGDTDLGKLAP
jgi:hypothetical protein